MRSRTRVSRRGWPGAWLLGLVVTSAAACGGSSTVPPPNGTGGSAGATTAGDGGGATGSGGGVATGGGAGTTNGSGGATGAGGGAGTNASGGATGTGGGAAGSGGSAGSGAGAGGRAGASGGGGAAGAGTAGTRGSDGGTDAAPTPCDPLAQTTCPADERCSWVATSATAGHAVCLPDGAVAQGGACAAGAYGETTGFDNCRRGLACANGQCQPICKTSPDSCGAHFLCTNYSSVFYSNGTSVAGVCAPTCNPLTQARDYDGAAACGTTGSGSPALGCFGKSVFTCAKVVYPDNKSDAPAAGPSSGGFYLNGCAPGYLPVLTSATGSTQQICVALCHPGPTSVGSTAQVAGVTPSTCPAAGAASPHECRYWWWLQNTSSASFPDALSNTMGFCIDYTKYTGDKTGAGNTPYPSCTALSSTAHTYDATLTDAQYWGCQPYPTSSADAAVL
jgi:hypothetical protein